jgi:sugar O-acyltransferase (sialic acid O-acetyltransferase NeuD family)
MKNKLIIIGASGHGGVVADLAELLGYSVCFWDDDVNKNLANYLVSERGRYVPENSSLILGIGSNFIRENISLQYPKDSFITLIHPNANISRNTKVGKGSIVVAGVCINNGTFIGDHCIINTGAVVDHDCLISDFVHISPNATLCGNVSIGKGSWVGAGAILIHGIKVGENTVIGAGAVIIKDVPDYAIVVGNPGKIIKIGSNNYEE